MKSSVIIIIYVLFSVIILSFFILYIQKARWQPPLLTKLDDMITELRAFTKLDDMSTELRAFTKFHEMSRDLRAFCQMLFTYNAVDSVSQHKGMTLVRLNSPPSHDVILVPLYHAYDIRLIQHLIDACDKNTFIFIVDGEPNPGPTIPQSASNVFLISTKQEYVRQTKNSVYVPYAGMFMVENNLDVNMLRLSRAKSHGLDAAAFKRRPRFTMFAYSNDNKIRYEGTGERDRFYAIMRDRYGARVENLGSTGTRLLDGNGSIRDKKTHFDNNKVQREFQFVIAFENVCIEGYVTEKLLNPIIAGAIPIYRGAPDVNKYFNPDAFINVKDYASFEDCADAICKLSDTQLDKILNAPLMLAEQWNSPWMNYAKRKGHIFRQVFDAIPISLQDIFHVPSLFACKTIFVTFADGEKYKTDRIGKEARDSQYFDEVYEYGPDNLPLSFDASFCQEHKRGFGFYKWKSVIVHSALKHMNYGDILVWCDSGSTVLPFKGRKCFQYFDALVSSSTKSIMGFRIKYLEAQWNKKTCVDELVGSDKAECLKVNPNQFCSGLLICKKTPESISMASEWQFFSELDNGRLLVDSPPDEPQYPGFVEHRHDQSVLSLLLKKYAHNVIVNDDNYSDERTDVNNTMLFVSSRIR